VLGCCECGNDFSFSIKCAEFICLAKEFLASKRALLYVVGYIVC